ncbi:MAG: hypothetical protein HN759_09440, partial [Akkermansiaceae bacterium]|nr:hypothetical protein [Akkermansiaceae bacterium]
RHAWINQEIVKGGQNIGAEALIDDVHGGWEFNFVSGQYVPAAPPLDGYYKWDTNPNGPTFSRKYTPAEAADLNDISDAALKTKPFYDPFKYAGLYDASTGSAVAALPEVRYNLLASAIPASSYAVAPNSVDLLREHPLGDRDFNMQEELKNRDQYGAVFWKENDATYGPDWIHSDFRDMAFTYVWPMYERMMELGNLNE